MALDNYPGEEPERSFNSPHSALIIIDMQKAIDDPYWAASGPRNNTGAENNIARLLATWRRQGWSIFHVAHDSGEPDSTFRSGGQGAPFKPEAMPLAGETVLRKNTANAFLSTDLDARLKELRIRTLVIAGVVTNNSVESTVRMAAETGYAVTVAEDATFTFARRDRRGHLWTAEDVHALSLANLEQGGYARVTSTAALCAQSHTGV